MSKKTQVVTRSDLKARYPDVPLTRWYWCPSEDDPLVGWPVDTEFQPTHKVEFFAYGAGRFPTLVDYVYLEPGERPKDYQEAFTPVDYSLKTLSVEGRPVCDPSYLKDPTTGKWWHARNLHLSWVRGKCRAVPVTYMRDLPSEFQEPEAQWGFVYFVEAGEGGPVKIGWSQDVPRRIEELQVGNAHKLYLLGTTPGTMADEVRIHKLFEHLRMESEWFQNAPEIHVFIEQTKR